MGPDIFRWGGSLPRERVGAKKFDTSLETREIKLFGRDIPGFCRDIPEVPEKFEKKKFVFNFRSLNNFEYDGNAGGFAAKTRARVFTPKITGQNWAFVNDFGNNFVVQGGKNFGQAFEILEKQAFRCGRP